MSVRKPIDDIGERKTLSNRESDALFDLVFKERNRYEKALKKIQSKYGGVCDTYEICTHKACQDSYAAWATADNALRGEDND